MKPYLIKKRSVQFNRYPRQPARMHQVGVVAITGGSLALVMIDSTRIRRDARKKYDSVRKQMETVKLRLDEFHTLDMPAYSRWFHLRFGPILEEIRELVGKIDQSERILQEVYSIAAVERISLQEAYQRHLAFEKGRNERTSIDPAKPGESSGQPPPREGQDSDDPDPFGSDGEQEDPFQNFRDLFEKMFGIFNGVKLRRSPDHKRRVKELYRKLARALHPDAQGEVSEEMRSWWLQSQEAYQADDVSQLELLLHLVEEKQGTAQQMTSVSSLYQMTLRMRATLRGMKRELRKHEKNEAWGCAKAPPGPQIEREVESGLLRELLPAKARFAILERKMAELQSPRIRSPQKQGKPKPYAPVPQSQDTFPF